MKLFFDSGASRSYLSEKFYDSNPVLHDMPRFVTTCPGIRIGNGSIVQALFVILLLFMSCGHTFEIFTIVAEIDDDMDLVFGFKNLTETEGMLNTRTGEYDFIGRSIPMFPHNDLDVPAGEKAYIKVKAPFCDKLSGMIWTKFFGRDMHWWIWGGGACWAHTPLWYPILSFVHTFSLKSTHMRGPCPS